MASHAHSTRTPLLRQTTGSAGLLPASIIGGRIVAAGGPVTRALAVMAGANPDLARIRSLRRSIADRIEADIALLDMLAGDSDFEDGNDAEPSLCGLDVERPSYGGDDREAGDDNGIADLEGAGEQGFSPYAYGYDRSQPFEGGCGL